MRRPHLRSNRGLLDHVFWRNGCFDAAILGKLVVRLVPHCIPCPCPFRNPRTHALEMVRGGILQAHCWG